jgi:putative transposase
MMQGLLAAEGCKIGRRHVKTLIKRMGRRSVAVRERLSLSQATRSIRI